MFLRDARSRCPWVAMVLSACLAWSTGWSGHAGIAAATDQVWLRPASSGTSASGASGTRRQGEVLEYTGERLRLRLPDGRVEEIAGSRVVRVVPALSDLHQSADRLRVQGRLADALTTYRQARQQEPRDWVRRLIMAHETDCYAALGQVRYAGETFLALIRSDPATPHLDVIPLAWVTSRADLELEQAASGWLVQADLPASRLLGASWLISSPQRQAAIDALRQLAADRDARIAFLAEAQLWRTEFATRSLEEVRGWERRIRQMPVSLRYGPYYVLGRGLAHHQQPEDAALALLRLPLQYAERSELAAQALWDAAGQLEKAGQVSESAELYRELATRFVASQLAGPAQQRAQELSTPERNSAK
ncbi:MAG: hypothetical protein J5I93_08205 [Pirellulaceae bacterium]|nr:hypothetical protein [Pirellulaceae bacterium]